MIFGLCILFIFLLVLSAFFSSLETALFHVKSYQNVNSTVKKLISNPKKLLASLLTGNTIVNIAIGSLAAYYTLNFVDSDLSKSSLLLIEVFIVTIILTKNLFYKLFSSFQRLGIFCTKIIF